MRDIFAESTPLLERLIAEVMKEKEERIGHMRWPFIKEREEFVIGKPIRTLIVGKTCALTSVHSDSCFGTRDRWSGGEILPIE
jgi:hypothetical protein